MTTRTVWPSSSIQARRVPDGFRSTSSVAGRLPNASTGGGAAYLPWTDGEKPWHSAMAALYAHATAPLRRLADRYVVLAALDLANGRPVPAATAQAFDRLPPVMARAESLGAKVAGSVSPRGTAGGVP